MKATLIISQEYKHNQPSVFILAEDNQYYGCLIYPKSRNFPQNADYWRNAICSDADRYFIVKDVEYTEDDFESIIKLQKEIDENVKCLKTENSYRWIPRPDASQNSKIYKEYLAKMEEQQKSIRDIYEYNRPFDKIIYGNRTELRKILLSVLPDEN